MTSPTEQHAAAAAPATSLVKPEAIAELVKSGQPGIAVVDVRNEQEFAAGHVKGALNLDSTAFASPEQVDKLIAQLEAKSQVVVHCAKSQQRGPAAAAALRQRLQELGVTGKEVVVMEGGFNKFSELYAADSSVVDKGPGTSSGAVCPVSPAGTSQPVVAAAMERSGPGQLLATSSQLPASQLDGTPGRPSQRLALAWPADKWSSLTAKQLIMQCRQRGLPLTSLRGRKLGKQALGNVLVLAGWAAGGDDHGGAAAASTPEERAAARQALVTAGVDVDVAAIASAAGAAAASAAVVASGAAGDSAVPAMQQQAPVEAGGTQPTASSSSGQRQPEGSVDHVSCATEEQEDNEGGGQEVQGAEEQVQQQQQQQPPPLDSRNNATAAAAVGHATEADVGASNQRCHAGSDRQEAATTGAVEAEEQSSSKRRKVAAAAPAAAAAAAAGAGGGPADTATEPVAAQQGCDVEQQQDQQQQQDPPRAAAAASDGSAGTATPCASVSGWEADRDIPEPREDSDDEDSKAAECCAGALLRATAISRELTAAPRDPQRQQQQHKV